MSVLPLEGQGKDIACEGFKDSVWIWGVCVYVVGGGG